MGAELESNRELTKNELENALVVMSNAIARKQTKWSARETKLFFTALSQIKWRSEDNWVTMNKADVIEKLEMDPNDTSKLRNLFKNVVKKSYIEFDGPTEEEWLDGVLLTSVKSTRKQVSVQFNSTYLPLLDKLDEHFTMFQLDNVAHFKSKYAIILFQRLKSHYNPEGMINHIRWSLDELKRIFELDKDAYVVTDKKTGQTKFHIYNFEKYVLFKARDEINADSIKSGMRIESIEKLKTHGKTGFVTGYDIAFSLVNKDGFRRYDKFDKKDEIGKKLSEMTQEEYEQYMKDNEVLPGQTSMF